MRILIPKEEKTMAIDKDRINARSDLAITAGVFVLAVAVGIVSYFLFSGFGVIGAIGTAVLIFGAYMLVRAVFASGEEKGFGPSSRSYGLVWGVLLVAIALCAIISATVPGVSVWIYVAVILLAIAMLAIALGVSNKKELN
jgi:uncharacterized membrane protein HdeD (DUF308 family)